MRTMTDSPLAERKLAAILAADVEGYARLMHADEERTFAILTSHRGIFDRLIEAAHGQIVGSAGDSVLAEFQSVVEAYQCAIAIQQAIAQANAELPEAERMRFRIGINVGDVMVHEGDLFGDGVNVAARIQALAEPGGICVARAVRDQLRDRVDATFEDLGEHSVKNIARPVRVFRACFDPDAEPVLPNAATPPPPAEEEVPEIPADSAEIAFWQSVQASDDDVEYRLYLQRYPTGTFADLARIRLASDTRQPERTRTEAEIELAFWDTVRASGNSDMIAAYLQKYPDGEFRELAEILLRTAAPSRTATAPA
jgi:adenylate cyclase